MAILEIDPFRFERGHLSFEIPRPVALNPGEVVCLSGEPDALVSEFLHVLIGLNDVKRLTEPAGERELVRPVVLAKYSNGEAVRIVGLPIRKKTTIDRANDIAIVFDNPELAIIGRTVAEEFRYTSAALGKAPSEYPDPLVLGPYGLHDKIERRTEVLSGGEQHRLAIACAMERDSRVLVLDLTRSNLDHEFEEWLLRRLDPWLELRTRTGGAVVLLAGCDIDRVRTFTRATVRSAVLTGQGLFNIDAQLSGAGVTLPAIELRPIGAERLVTAVDVGRLTFGRRQSFAVNNGDIIAFHGPNGCGKTSIALLLAGRESPHRFGGSLHIQSGIRPALSLQHAERSFIGMSVREELSNDRLAQLLGFSSSELESHPRMLPYRKQKLLSSAVATELARGLVILDEPSCGMDDSSKSRLIELINSRKDLAFLVFSHDVELQRLLHSRELGSL